MWQDAAERFSLTPSRDRLPVTRRLPLFRAAIAATVAVCALIGVASAPSSGAASAAPVRSGLAPHVLRSLPFTNDAHLEPCTSTPFSAVPSKHVWYRVPSIAKSSYGVVYAFAEKRNTATSDRGPFKISMAKSGDNGCSWTTPKVIADYGTHRLTNPVSVRLWSGDVLVAMSGDDGRLFWYTSTDGFAQRHEVPQFVEDKVGITGIGHGVAAYQGLELFLPVSMNGFRAGALTIDESLKHWDYTDRPPASPKGHSLIEGTLAVRSDDSLLSSWRDRDASIAPGHNRFQFVSNSAGNAYGFSTMKKPAVVAVGASLLSGSGSRASTMYFSAPAWVTAGHYTSRRELSIFVSKDDGATWHPTPYPLELDNRPGGYSDMALLDGQTMGVLYENGRDSYVEKIRFTSVKLGTLATWKKIASSLTHGTLTAKGVSVTAHAVGAANPWGSVTLHVTNTATHKVVTVKKSIGFTSHGRIVIPLPKLAHGHYTVTASYTGTTRISGSTTTVGGIRL